MNFFIIYANDFSGKEYLKELLLINFNIKYIDILSDNILDILTDTILDSTLIIYLIRNPLTWITNNNENNINTLLNERYILYKKMTIYNNKIILKYENIIIFYNEIIKYLHIKYNLVFKNNYIFPKINIDNIDLLNLEKYNTSELFDNTNNRNITKYENIYFDSNNLKILTNQELEILNKNIDLSIENTLNYNIISYVPKFCFFHIEKCMGTSLRESFYNYFLHYYRPKQIYFPDDIIHNNRNLTNYNDLLYICNYKSEVILAHCSFNKINVTEYFSKHCYSITCIREPIKRFISHYYFFLKKIYNKNIQELSSYELSNILYNENNVITWRLSGEINQIEVAFNNIEYIKCILITENITEDIKYLNNILNYKLNLDEKIIINLLNETNNIYNSFNDYDYLKNNYINYFDKDINLYNSILNMPINKRIKE
jgi:hypothetical protein